MSGHQRETNDIAAAQHDFRFRFWREPNDAAFAGKRSGYVKIADAVEREPLRTPEAAEKYTHFARGSDPVDAVVARRRRAGNKKIARRAKREMVRRDGRLERGEDENFALRADLENRAASVAHVKAAVLIEREPSGYPHALNPLHRAPVGRDAVNRAVVAAGHKKMAFAIDGEPGGICQFGDIRFDRMVRRDLVKRNGHFLAALAAKRDVNVTARIHGGVHHRMQVIGDLHTQ